MSVCVPFLIVYIVCEFHYNDENGIFAQRWEVVIGAKGYLGLGFETGVGKYCLAFGGHKA
jgi:hypothetical protein